MTVSTWQECLRAKDNSMNPGSWWQYCQQVGAHFTTLTTSTAMPGLNPSPGSGSQAVTALQTRLRDNQSHSELQHTWTTQEHQGSLWILPWMVSCLFLAEMCIHQTSIPTELPTARKHEKKMVRNRPRSALGDTHSAQPSRSIER